METVADILASKGRDVWTVEPDTTIGDAARLMGERNIGAVLVLDDEEKPVGILSERDVVRGLLRLEGDISRRPVRDLMTERVKSVKSSLTIEDAMAVMTHNRFRHLPVRGDAGELIGLISIGDVVKAAIHEREFVIDQLEHYIAGSL